VRMLVGNFRFQADAPAAVEMTVFRQPERHRYLVSLVNFQKDLPNIPIDGITVQARLEGERVTRVVRLPHGSPIESKQASGVLSFSAPRLETLAMFAVETA